MDTGPLTIEDASRRMHTGELTPSSLLEICLKRVDTYEPKVKAWAYLDRERARKEAEILTKELKEGKDRGALHGIPIGIKDIIDVADMPTGCGSKLWANSYARQDAECVRKLRNGGALIMGKTVTTPYAYLDPPATRNPWNHERTPGGSSSGSAAAVACGMCLGALATQTGGSTIRPAAYCGVYAMKPTYGSISTEGCLPLAPTLDHIGIMANSIISLKYMYMELAVEYDSDYTKYVYSRRSIATNNMFTDRLAAEEHEHYLETLNRLGSQIDNKIEQKELLPDFPNYWQDYRTLISREAYKVHRERIKRKPDDYPAEITALIQAGNSLSPDTYEETFYRINTIRSDVVSLLFQDGHWVWLTPASMGAAPKCDTTGDPYFNIPWSFTGLPAICIPTGLGSDGLPRAIQIIGQKHSDAHFLRYTMDNFSNLFPPPQLPPV